MRIKNALSVCFRYKHIFQNFCVLFVDNYWIVLNISQAVNVTLQDTQYGR